MSSRSGPSHLGRYAVRRRIGSGGFATVWLAYDEQLDTPVAIKVLADNWSEQHQVRSRFLEEGRYLRRVDSPHVVPAFDAGELDDGRPFLVMAYADQGSLADRLETSGLTVPQALAVVRQVGAGLQALHDRGILHRDVKPANVLFRTVDPDAGADGVRAMVGDLGLGKTLDSSSRLTMIAGTPAFVAPEQAQGETLDARADQYSLGVLAFLLLSGRLPWSHASLSAAADPTEPAPLSTPERPFPDDVEAVVRRALAPDRDERFASTLAFTEELDRAARGYGGAAGATQVLPVDSARTQPGFRPSPLPVRPTRADGSDGSDGSDDVADDGPTPRRGRRVLRGLAVPVAAAVAFAVGGAGGYVAGEPAPVSEVSLADDSGTVSVTVPAAWDAAASTAGWVPPDAEGRTFPALSAGTSVDWAYDADTETFAGEAHGVFVGVLPGSGLPDLVPQHAECDDPGDPVMDDTDEGASMTVVFAGCPDGVTVERVVQVATDRLLWVQVRSDDLATANRVLDDVEVHGL